MRTEPSKGQLVKELRIELDKLKAAIRVYVAASKREVEALRSENERLRAVLEGGNG
jgi:hypothetical protein